MNCELLETKIMDLKKYISPGGWFSLQYPAAWSEFEDETDCFLFYNPEKWDGNFRISAYKDRSSSYARESITAELKRSEQVKMKKVGRWDCAYSCETFMEGNEAYTSHFWVTGEGNVSVECSFTVLKGSPIEIAEQILSTLEIRQDGRRYPKECIPVRVLEVNEINQAYDWASSYIKKALKKDFTASERDLAHMQTVMDSGKLSPRQCEAWQALGLTFGTVLVNEMDGMEWVTVIDGKQEYPALRFADTDLLVCPLNIFASQVARGETCNVKKEFERIKKEVEERL